MKAGPSQDYRNLLAGLISPDEYVRRLKRDVDARMVSAMAPNRSPEVVLPSPYPDEALAAQAVWRSEPEIVKALDALDEFSSLLSQGYAHSGATMDGNLAKLLRLSGTVSRRVRSSLRVQTSAADGDVGANTDADASSEKEN